MRLPNLWSAGELLMWERCGFFGFLLASSFFENQHKFLLRVAVVTFMAIYWLYFYNFVRDYFDTDGKKEKNMSDNHKKFWETKFLLTRDLEKERHNVSRFLEKNAKLENENVNLAYQLEEERQKVSGLQQSQTILEKLEDEKAKLASQLEEKRLNISRFIEKNAKLEIENVNRASQLEEERQKVLDLERLEDEKAKLGYQLEEERHNISWSAEKIGELETENANLACQLEEERQKVSNLQYRQTLLEDSESELRKQCEEIWKANCPTLEEEEEVNNRVDNNTTLEEHNAHLANALDSAYYKIQEEREYAGSLQSQVNGLYWGNRFLNDELDKKSAELEEEKKLVKQLKTGIEEKTNNNQQVVVAKKKVVKKVSQLEKRCKKLKEEKKALVAERESLVVSLNSQATVMEAYKDMLDKDECLIKLFQNAKP